MKVKLLTLMFLSIIATTSYAISGEEDDGRERSRRVAPEPDPEIETPDPIFAPIVSPLVLPLAEEPEDAAKKEKDK